MEWILFILHLIAIPVLSPLSIGIIRKIKARFQNRVGASIFQPYRDLMKLFRKNEVISEDASWIFTTAPYLIFGSTLALAAGIPLVLHYGAYLPTSDLLVFAYLLAFGAFFLALAGMDTGSGFGGFGASREMMIAALTEGGLILSLVAAAFIAGASNIAVMPALLAGIHFSQYLPLALAGAAFFIALLAENARYPVDNPATHLELTMVHEAMILEYSGKRLALLEWAAANKLLIFIAIFVNVFLPFGLPVSFTINAIALGFIVFLFKASMALAGIAFIEGSMAKFRIFRVPDLLFTSFVLSVIAIIIAV